MQEHWFLNVTAFCYLYGDHEIGDTGFEIGDAGFENDIKTAPFLLHVMTDSAVAY